ncbi:hypothetical protein FH972_020527 [Carpinus fangiana]|uniref:Uncharacterized protein n=1 Tax=Carpinus fangiana TaxID=176857 RepID=A0A5N6RWY6_9ROSI|nr:hypothetical protein FH972_020527 [Carpinus fangiana]
MCIILLMSLWEQIGVSKQLLAEEDVQTLSKADSADLLAAVVNTVNECLAEATLYGLQRPDKSTWNFTLLKTH